MKYLLDTNAFIALLGDPDLLSASYRRLLVDPGSQFVLRRRQQIKVSI